jgi:uncharacterized membrane protein YoaK (UPF0700 family)
MTQSRIQSFGSLVLWLSLLTFAIFFLNVLIGGPLGKKPWMSDVWEMLTLFAAVVFFVAGTLCREVQSARGNADKEVNEGG